MLLHPLTNILVKKLFGNNLVNRFVKYLIKYVLVLYYIKYLYSLLYTSLYINGEKGIWFIDLQNPYIIVHVLNYESLITLQKTHITSCTYYILLPEYILVSS